MTPPRRRKPSASSPALPAPRHTASQGLALLEAHGEILPGGGYCMAPETGPLAWAGLVQVAANFGDRWQWVLADLLLDGAKWETVRAVRLSTGQPDPDEDGAYSGDPDLIPWEYFQILSELDDRVPRARQYRMMSTARRFVRDPAATWYRFRPEWHAAQFEHYVQLAAADLPWSLVHELLTKAGRPKSDGGLSVRDIIRQRERWRAERDMQRRAETVALEEADSAPVVTIPAGGAEVEAAPKVLTWPVARKRYTSALARWMVQAVPGTGALQAEQLANAVLWWLYHEAAEELLTGALAWEGDVPWEPVPE